MNLEQQVVELEKSIQTITEAHHTALEVERKKVRELEAQLAQAQAALNPKIEPGTCSRCGNSTTLVQEVAHEYLCRGCIETSGWLSPDEAKALQAQCAAMREALGWLERYFEINIDGGGRHSCPWCYYSKTDSKWSELTHDDKCPIGKALSTTAGQELLDRLAKYEKQWNDMNFTICKLEQDLHAKEKQLGEAAELLKLGVFFDEAFQRRDKLEHDLRKAKGEQL